MQHTAATNTSAPTTSALASPSMNVSCSLEMAVIPSPSLSQQCIFETCSQPRISSSFDYCNRHILQDISAPYKQCAYIYNSTGKRCLATAPKGDKRDGYCGEHSRKQLSMRLRASRQKAVTETADTLLNSLSHYIPQQSGKHVNPFADIDAAKVNSSVSRVLELASESDSECEGGAVTLDAAWSGDSETEGDSPDSDLEDPLRHSGVFTEEEVVNQARDRLKRLQTLYVREFRSLQFRLREQRRFCLMAQKREKETLMSIHQQPKKTAEDLAAYRRLQALNHYRKPHGVESVLHKKAKDRKAQALLVTPGNRHSHASRCIFMEGGVKCDDKALPVAKLCLRHILNDSQQLLFRGCGVSRTELPPCQEPVLSIFANASCLCHRSFPSVHQKEQLVTPVDSLTKEEKIEVKEETADLDVEMVEITDVHSFSSPPEDCEVKESVEVKESGEVKEKEISSPAGTICLPPEPVSDSRRRKQDFKEIVNELPQDSDNENASISANDSFSSDVLL